MGRQCTVCGHADRVTIDEQIVLGLPALAQIAEERGLSPTALKRHRDGHLSQALRAVVVAEREEREQAGPRRVLDRAEELLTRVERLLDTAEDAGQLTTALSAMRETRATLELIAKITGELDERAQVAVVNVGTDPEWLRIRGLLFAALEPHPAAQVAVATALALEAGT